MTVLRSEFEAEEEKIQKLMADIKARENTAIEQRTRMARVRKTEEETCP
jgi:hypothetical protein